MTFTVPKPTFPKVDARIMDIQQAREVAARTVATAYERVGLLPPLP